VNEIGSLCDLIHKINPNAAVIVDNCYGEFVEKTEPTDVGADLVAGSLIKNPGGGLAPAGGYLAGRHDLVEAAAMRLTVPGIGRECGASLGHNRLLYQGLFLAPHTVAQALKTAAFAARMMELLGYPAEPGSLEQRHDIVQMIRFGAPEPIKKFCLGIQRGAPVDSFVTPEPWDMPGYDCQVIMAAGAFIQGSSIELSCDAPMREPYIVYFQGGTSRHHVRIAVTETVKNMMSAGLL
jgi:cystathionine beta-lyase family protein involved in aluminum resistance